MSEYAIVAPEDFDQSVFRLIGKEWMLVTAKRIRKEKLTQ